MSPTVVLLHRIIPPATPNDATGTTTTPALVLNTIDADGYTAPGGCPALHLAFVNPSLVGQPGIGLLGAVDHAATVKHQSHPDVVAGAERVYYTHCDLIAHGGPGESVPGLVPAGIENAPAPEGTLPQTSESTTGDANVSRGTVVDETTDETATASRVPVDFVKPDPTVQQGEQHDGAVADAVVTPGEPTAADLDATVAEQAITDQAHAAPTTSEANAQAAAAE